MRFEEMSVRRTVLRGTVHRETLRQRNAFGELSIGEKSVSGNVRRGTLLKQDRVRASI